jgi:hypothetical protein
VRGRRAVLPWLHGGGARRYRGGPGPVGRTGSCRGVCLHRASETLRISGIDADLNTSGRYDAIKPRVTAMDRATQAKEIRQLISSPDVVVGSVAAVTETGSIVAASGNGFQIPAYAAGAGQVVLVVGAQKIVPDLEAAMERLESHVLPLEDARSMAAYGAHSATNRVLILNGEPFGRVTVLLLRQVIGF